MSVQNKRLVPAVALAVNAAYLASGAYRDPTLRAFLSALAILSAVFSIVVWTSNRWQPALARNRGSVRGAVAEVLALPVLAAALLLVLAAIVAVGFLYVGGRIWR